MNLLKLSQLPDDIRQRACFDPGQDHYSFDQSPLWYDLLGHYGLDHGRVEYYQCRADRMSVGGMWLPALRINSHARFAPDYLQSLSNYYSSAYEPFAATDERVSELVEAWARANPQVDIFDINLLLKDSSAYQAVIIGFKSAGLWVQPYFRFSNWILTVQHRSFDDYFQSLPSKLKNTLARKQRKLDREVDWHIEIVQAGGDLEQALTDYERVYAASWKTAETHNEFIRQFVLQSARLYNWPRLGLLYVDGQPIAAQLWFVKDQCASIFKLVYHENYKHYSPGSVLTQAMMQATIDTDQVQVVDYLTGDDAYKQDWMNQRRERWAVRGFNPRRLKGCAAAVHSFGRGMTQQILSKARGS